MTSSLSIETLTLCFSNQVRTRREDPSLNEHNQSTVGSSTISPVLKKFHKPVKGQLTHWIWRSVVGQWINGNQVTMVTLEWTLKRAHSKEKPNHSSHLSVWSDCVGQHGNSGHQSCPPNCTPPNNKGRNPETVSLTYPQTQPTSFTSSPQSPLPSRRRGSRGKPKMASTPSLVSSGWNKDKALLRVNVSRAYRIFFLWKGQIIFSIFPPKVLSSGVWWDSSVY